MEERQESLGSINDSFGLGGGGCGGVDKTDRRYTFNMSVTDHTGTAIKHLHKHKGLQKKTSLVCRNTHFTLRYTTSKNTPT